MPITEPHTEPHTEPRRLGWGVVHKGAPRALGRLRTFARREGRAGGEHGPAAAWSNDAATKNLASLASASPTCAGAHAARIRELGADGAESD